MDRVERPDGPTSRRRELRAVAERMGWEIVRVYSDAGISGAKGRDQRPAFDTLCKDAARRQFDVVMVWSVDRLGRSLQDLVGFLSGLHALKIDLMLHQQGLDTAAAQNLAPVLKEFVLIGRTVAIWRIGDRSRSLRLAASEIRCRGQEYFRGRKASEVRPPADDSLPQLLGFLDNGFGERGGPGGPPARGSRG
jgi:Resolvase, N terminal domain